MFKFYRNYKKSKYLLECKNREEEYNKRRELLKRDLLDILNYEDPRGADPAINPFYALCYSDRTGYSFNEKINHALGTKIIKVKK